MQNRLIAVDDIHGEIEKLKLLLNKLDLKLNDKVIFWGDYIDRGEHSKAVLRMCIILLSLQRFYTRFYLYLNGVQNYFLI